ncbi:NAD-dependent protein deacetylase [Saccharothrix obliqua]|uniref:NAD-dependent protein deacetylase n=1 Tax=Saccharothrix obliqua TaxID=2861747 RepID=UPI001C5CD4B8|nr:NAD-dependent protein deacetylase [Saccharothrix obliqua]MBW4716845.1 NAD-dependent protein deacetylase [Saccharothrix obliqua]
MRTRPTLSWTATGAPLPRTRSVDDVVRAVAERDVLVLSGAGLSTESGIPDYRGVSGSLRRHTPMTYDEFTGSPAARRRYWARSHLGWRTIARADPNAGHRAVAALGAAGFLSGVITQNVDGLHHAAGTDAVELHGNLDRVVCLSCRAVSAREDLDRRLRAANEGFTAAVTRFNPDGDADLAEEDVRGFRVVACVDCGGVLKPDVVFFGENVPRVRVEECYALVDAARSVLVLGSSLTVMSGLRFVRRAATAGKPVVIVNQGATRGDEHATTRVDLPLGRALTDVRRALGA